MNANQYIKSICGQSLYDYKEPSSDVFLSKLEDYNATNQKANFSIKTVLNGTEKYRINGHSFHLTNHEYLVVNQDSEVELKVDQANTKGICLYPSVHLLNDVYRNVSSKEIELLDDPFELVTAPNFTEKKYRFKDNQTGKFLACQIDAILDSFNRGIDVDMNEFYGTLLDKLISDQEKVNKLLNSLNSAKQSTKEELLRRVEYAKNYIEDNYREKLSLEEIAENAFLSKYHFVRSFKSLYQISPIQFLLQIRLKKANELLQQEYSFSEVNDMVGFSDAKNLRKAIGNYRRTLS